MERKTWADVGEGQTSAQDQEEDGILNLCLYCFVDHEDH